MAAHGFVFADPQSSPDNFDTFNPQDVFADSKVSANAKPEKIPSPWRTPPVMTLEEVLGAAAVTQIQNAGQLAFHSVGDTGGIKEPARQFAVADALAADLQGKTLAKNRPAFFYHLGDVVYYFGQEKYYYDQFYDPYRNYDAPIFAIPGNHDAVTFAGEPVKFSLEPFVNNFCTKTPGKSRVAGGIARTTMTQPGVYFALDAPFARIIGLYSNTSEGATEGLISGPVVGNEQVTFLVDRLKEIADERKKGKGRAVILATHHPPFTGSSQHVPSPGMLRDIDGACEQTGVWPDLVLSGHAHLYERYTRTMKADGREIAYL
ncbi:MAG: metallophosphoesterase, partial [Acidobacteria bacterium]|nr:metallophosphoesterase [Acidobacteriota bacterium]